jgi:hypothetical protein
MKKWSARSLFTSAINFALSPWGAALGTVIVYLLVSYLKGQIFRPSDHPYYSYLADAFLHGQSWLRVLPPRSVHDLIFLNGHYFLYWAPFPAFLLIPFVALFGVELNDVIYTILIAAFNVGLVSYLLLIANEKGFLRLSRIQRFLLVAAFAFGSVHFFLAPFGKVWMTGQLVGFSCTLLAYIAAFSLRGWKAWFFTGLSLACAMLTRNQMVFTGIFPAIYLLMKEKPWIWKHVFRHLAVAALPLLAGLGFLLYYNNVRFGSPFNNGLDYHNMAESFKADYQMYGPFNLHYVPKNIYYQYIFYPFPYREESTVGGSLFLLSPVFFAAFASFYKPRSKIYLWALVASILVTNIPILLLMGTGQTQFGPRYTLDFTVPLLLMTALGLERWKTWLIFLLTGISILHYSLGLYFLTF